jgi:hypothetical protein
MVRTENSFKESVLKFVTALSGAPKPKAPTPETLEDAVEAVLKKLMQPRNP